MTTNNFKYAQVQPYSLSGAGATAGDTSIILNSMLDIDGNALTMSSDFGTIGYGTLEPGNGTLEEQISFTGITNNSNGTTTLTGVHSVAFLYPYTSNSGLAKTHAGNTTFVISNTSGFYNGLVAKNDDATITGQYTFDVANFPQMSDATTMPAAQANLTTKAYVDSIAILGAPNASTSTQGLVQLATQAQVDAKTATGSTGAKLAATPDLARSTLFSDYVVDTGTANIYAIAPSPAISAYTTGQIFTFKAINTNTLTSTLNVNGKGAQTIQRGGSNLGAGDIVTGQVYMVEYDGTNFQLISAVNSTPSGVIQMYAAASAPTGWLLCDGSSYLRTTYPILFGIIGTTYGTADGTHFNVPDMRGRVPLGVGTGTGGGASGTGAPTGGTALTAVALATWKGEETHTLLQAELPNVNFAAPIQVQNNSNPGGSGTNYMISGGSTNVPSGGSGTPFNEIQPVMGLNFIIKT